MWLLFFLFSISSFNYIVTENDEYVSILPRMMYFFVCCRTTIVDLVLASISLGNIIELTDSSIPWNGNEWIAFFRRCLLHDFIEMLRHSSLKDRYSFKDISWGSLNPYFCQPKKKTMENWPYTPFSVACAHHNILLLLHYIIWNNLKTKAMRTRLKSSSHKSEQSMRNIVIFIRWCVFF